MASDLGEPGDVEAPASAIAPRMGISLLRPWSCSSTSYTCSTIDRRTRALPVTPSTDLLCWLTTATWLSWCSS